MFVVASEKIEIDYIFRISILEVYNEKLNDLLVEKQENIDKLEIRMGSNDAVFVEGIEERIVTSATDVEKLLLLATSQRITANNNINERSSRSHLVLTCHILGKDRRNGKCTTGKLTLVDLAGSERLKTTEAAGIVSLPQKYRISLFIL